MFNIINYKNYMKVLNIIDGHKKMVDKYKIKMCNFLKKYYDASENKLKKKNQNHSSENIC